MNSKTRHSLHRTEVAFANMIAFKPLGITDIEAASVPVVAVTAWQMLCDYAHAERGQTVMVLGPISSESRTACDRSATKKETDYVQSLGARDACWRAA